MIENVCPLLAIGSRFLWKGTGAESCVGLGFENIGIRLQKFAWVNCLTIQTDFEMQMAARRPTGAAHLGDLKPACNLLPLPDIDGQARIVDALETLSEETQRLATLYQRKHAALDELKKSLLHQAFTGDL